MPGHQNRGKGKGRGHGMARHRRLNSPGGKFSPPSLYDDKLGQFPTNTSSYEESEDTNELTMLKEKAKQITDQLALLKVSASATIDTGKTKSAFIDQELCTGCGRCIRACPTAALSLLDATAAVNVEKCTGCGLCVQECPLGAIALKTRSLFHNDNN